MLNTISRGELFVNSGRVISVSDHVKENHYLVKATVHASFRNIVYVVVITIAQGCGSVCNGTCTCKANAFGRCCHIAAVLLLINRHIMEFGHEGGWSFSIAVIVYICKFHATPLAIHTTTMRMVPISSLDLYQWMHLEFTGFIFHTEMRKRIHLCTLIYIFLSSLF